MKLLRDPLPHFLILGILLFVLFDLVADDNASYDSRVINVDRESLLTFVQYRSRAFEPERAAAQLDGMSAAELEQLIDAFVREEALHREAKALGVDQNDYVIKRRMIQSVEFITDGFVNAAVEISDEDVADYFEANKADYFVSPFVTFTHVFVNGKGRPREDVVAAAQRLLLEVNASGAAFSDAPRFGDRFPYFVNYVERDPQFVASHFGTPMAEQIFALTPDTQTWVGPFESPYGAHLVMLSRKADGRYPELAEVEAGVRVDAEREAVANQKDKAIQAIVDTYDVRRLFNPQSSGDAG